LLTGLLLIVGQNSYAQETGGKKLRNTKKAKPAKINNRKIKTATKTKAKGNPNKSRQQVESSDPAKWDWSKVMWFRARKSRYETSDYNPNKRPKRQTYDNKPNYRSEHREPGEGNGDLARPLIPYDARIDDKGPILVKKRKAKKPDLQDLGPTINTPVISIIRPEETLYKKKKDKSDRQVDGKRLYTAQEREKPKAYDQSRLESIKLDKNGPEKMDDTKLMNTVVDKNNPKPFDDKKLMTVNLNRDKPAAFDNKKLMTAEIIKPKKQDLQDDRLMVNVPKIERSKLHDERLLTVTENQYPSKTMKRISEDIAAYEGDYVYTIKKGKDYHPSSRHLASKKHGLPWLASTQQALSVFWSKVWPWDLQPSYVTEKKPKIRRDKKEGQIWDNTVHPDSWNIKPEQAESGEEQQNINR
jgi:hypothetical protein